MTEAQLIDACRSGDRTAQRTVYELHGPRIYRLLLRLTASPDDAFDLTQETFVRAFARIARFERRSGLGTWLFRIATNEALQLLRRRETERRHLRIVASERPRAAAEPAVADADADAMDDVLGQLQPPHRAILLLRYQEGLDYAEIADALDCSPGTVASRLNRARAELRAKWEKRASGREEPANAPHPT